MQTAVAKSTISVHLSQA